MKAYYGDNQFLGVNHSSGKGAAYLAKYSSAADIAETLKLAWEEGVRDFCFTVNDRTIEAVNLVKVDCPFNLHPALPYAQRVNELIAEKGFIGTIVSKVSQFGLLALILAGLAALFGQYKRLIKLLIISELQCVPMENVKSIGLLNVANDFVLGINRADLLYCFYEVVNDDLDCKPFFYTMNFPAMAELLWGNGYGNCAIVFNYNRAGFRTNPSKDKVRDCVEKYADNDSIAMSLFSGSNADEVNEVLTEVPSLSGVLFGSSSSINIGNNLRFLEETK
jgi:hypothetical protein